ncbi:MAG: hypothetical protein R3325_10950, partial [Thermoanaerobaculia bacterium]|nr:hypothetical protein [Thermoanaerobaculia bacterium]
DGKESVQIDVFKEADANIVALAKRVKEALGEFDLDEARRREEARRADWWSAPGARRGPSSPWWPTARSSSRAPSGRCATPR